MRTHRHPRSTLSIAQQAGKQSRIAFLDYVRIFSFVNVFNTHIFPAAGYFGESSNQFIDAFIRLANSTIPHILQRSTGVITFFLISGYIIAEVCTLEDPATFLVKRIFRIYPLYIFCVLAQFMLSDGAIPPWSALWPRFSLLGDFLGTAHVLNGVDWTLRIELVFYAYMAAIHSMRNSRFFDVIKLTIIFSTIVLCRTLPDFPRADEAAHATINAFFPFLLIGSLILYFERKSAPLWLMVLASCLLIKTSIDTSTAYGVAIFATAWFYRGAFRSKSTVTTLSSLTYAVYLIHAWYFGIIEHAIASKVGAPLSIALSIFVVAITAFAVVHTIERPMIRLGNVIITATLSISKPRRPAQSQANQEVVGAGKPPRTCSGTES